MLDDKLLSLIVFLPLAGAALIAILPRQQKQLIHAVAVASSGGALVFGLIALFRFDHEASGTMQFDVNVSWIESIGARYRMAIDGISLPLVVLTVVLTFLCVLYTTKIVPKPQEKFKGLFALMLLLETGMLGTFTSLDLILWFVFWEMVLVPMYFIISIWGSERKEYSAIKFFLYTFFGSVFMLLSFLALYFRSDVGGAHTFDMLELAQQGSFGTVGFQNLVFLGLFLGFAIKVPMWPFHTWLPDAHVEAPTAGSVILAGVLLKMGGYGMLRFNLPLFPDAAKTWQPYIIILSVIAIIYGALVALVQPDLKKLVAYSSVSHMGFVTLGIFAFNAQGLYGAMIVMISHGLVTGALFLLVGMIYNRGHTRLIRAFGGLATNMPVYAAFFGFFMLASIGLPGLSGFIGEFLAMLGGFQAYRWAGIAAMVVVILAAWYMMWMFQRVVWVRAPGEPPDANDPELRAPVTDTLGHGPQPIMGGSGHDEHFIDPRTFRDIDWTEIITLAPLAALTVWIGVYPNTIMQIMRPALEAILKPFGGSGF